MVDKAQPGSGDRGAQPDQYLRMRWPYPELPDDVAIAGRKRGKQYLYRPGELLVVARDLERNNDEMRRHLEGHFGAFQPDRRRARLCRDDATLLVDRDPNSDTVRSACRELKDLAGAARYRGSKVDLLRARLSLRHDRLLERSDKREKDGAKFLARQNIVMYQLPRSAPSVPQVLKELRKSYDQARTGAWANQVFTVQQDYEWVPATRPVRLEENLPPLEGKALAGKGVRVAVVDTGVRKAHQWLAHAEVVGDDEELDQDGDLELDFEAGHGTFIAGVVRQHAPGATIVGRSVVDRGGYVDDLDLGTALDSLQGACIDIVTLSVGGPADRLTPAPFVRRALSRLRAQNSRLAVVAAAGNRNRSDEAFYPAAFSDVIAVGALKQNLERAEFSNHGPWIDAWALGVDVVSSFVGKDLTATSATDPGGLDGARGSGTSFAAPRVAGAIAAAMRPGS